jgi:Mitochondrial ribosomal protein S25
MYLMKETKPPTQRYEEIHGFDESNARGQPCSTLPPFGNIPEPRNHVEKILATWNETQRSLETSLKQRQFLRNQSRAGSKDLRRAEIKHLSDQIHRLQKSSRKMCRLSPEVAYLQACSEFYMLRQQEEVETRIAIEQARLFRRHLGPTVNDKELEREQQALKGWKADAQRQYTMIDELRSKRHQQESELLDEEEADGDEGDAEVAEDSRPDDEVVV